VSEAGLSEERIVAVLRHAAVPDGTNVRALLDALWEHQHHDALPGQLELTAAEVMGREAALGGDDESAVVRRTLRLGRALADVASGELPAARVARLQVIADEAAAQAVASFARARYERREAWLSFLSHELKNPLNTILNALWLLKEHRNAPNADRFVELAERGVRRLEGGVKELRDLHRKAAAPPPSRADPTPAPKQ
jgi:signal transduction histidine kinase